MIPLLIIVAVIFTFFLLGVTQYNRLVRSQQMTQEGLSGIDVQLKRRADLIPNLLETVKGYMGHERQVTVYQTHQVTQHNAMFMPQT